MALLEWRDEFETGIAEVDFEHRGLFDLINSLYSAEGVASVEATDVLGRIHTAISAHFALEEKVMREAGYPLLAVHKADHEDLLDEIREIMDRFDEGGFVRGRPDLGLVLTNWFGHHFRTHDAQLHGSLSARPAD